jgi:glutamate-1-semialdehyde 2,1-aminomutase
LVEDTLLVAPYNDLERTSQIIAQHARELAAVIVEPLQRCTPPKPGFLEGLRVLTGRHQVLLIFDEVVTGFRLAYGGGAAYYGVSPDLVAYGKALGGGYPIGAFGGRADLMDLVREDRMGASDYVWTASTLGGNPVSCSAALAALGVYQRDGTYERLHGLGKYLRVGLDCALRERQARAQVIGDGPLAQVVFSDKPVFDYRSTKRGDSKKGRALMLGLFKRGVFLNPMGTKLYLSIAHDEAAIDAFLDRFDDALSEVVAGG